MKEFEVVFRASIGDQVRHKLTGFVGAVTSCSVNEQNDRQYYVESAAGPGQWITEKNLGEPLKKGDAP